MKARELSPLKKQELLNKSIYEFSHKNSGRSYLPSLFLSGKASYQSEVITMPEYPEIPKEQFNVNINLHQNIYDGGLSKHSRQIDASQFQISEMDLETQLYKMNEIINAIYFAILNTQESLKILKSSLEDLNNQKDLIAARVKNGVLLASNLYNLGKQILTIEQDIISVKSDHKTMSIMLSEWIGQEVTDKTTLQIPEMYDLSQRLPLNRPEIKLFKSQKEFLQAQYDFSNLSRTPKIWAFMQGGVGQPNPVNFFEVDPATYYIFGIQLNWDIYDWGNTRREKQTLKMQQEILDTELKDFERNLHISLIKEYREIEKLEKIIQKDDEIIELQEKIVETAFSELENGIITSTEYLTELNTLILSKIKKVIHELSLSNTCVKIYTSTGNIWNHNISENE
jgi:outer membrane protein TolC